MRAATVRLHGQIGDCNIEPREVVLLPSEGQRDKKAVLT